MSQALSRTAFAGLLGHQRVKSKRDVSSMGFLYLCLAGAFIAALVLFVYLWSRLEVVNLGYEISAANTARSALVEKNRRLSVERMELSSPARIERIAVSELGLAYPSAEQIVRVE